ncbi:MAG: hypothetical protein WD887_00215 [Candidatus Saccharimonadales bacterium]
MVAINHALTGGLVAVAIGKPVLALPAALVSHFLIDMLPHWNYQVPGGPKLRPILIGIDMLASAAVLIFIGLGLGTETKLFIAGGILGIVPDLMWAPYILHSRPAPMDKKTPLHMVRRLHLKIQWNESTRGLVVEMAWLLLMLLLIFRLN